MMNFRHIEELDLAVRVANHAVLAGRVRGEERLAHYLYDRWYATAPRAGAIPEQRRPSGRHWQVWSPHWSDETDGLGSDLVRLYLSCSAENAPRVVGLVTATAMSWQEPWRFWSVTSEGADSRADTTVLHLPIASLGRLRAELQALVVQLRPLLRPQTPAFTLRIGQGAALAQNPADGASFGRHRCSLVARAVVRSRGQLHRDQVTRATYTFAEAGVDPERPYRETHRGTWDQPWRAY